MKMALGARMVALVLALMALLSVSCAALAQEYYTLPEIREQAAQGWHETYTDKYGRAISVDINVEAYGEEKAPVLRVGFPNNDNVDHQRYHADLNHPSEALFAAKKRDGKTLYIYEAYDVRADLDKRYGEEYGSSLTVREAYTFIEELLSSQGLSSDEFLFEQPQTLRVKCGVHQKTGEVMVPVSYDITLWTKKHGLPILTHAGESHIKACFPPSFIPYLSFGMRSRDEYYIYDQTLEEKEVLAEDIPLCSLEHVIQSIEEQIEAGFIQKVYSLRFGFSVYNDPAIQTTKPLSSFDVESYYLVPSWILNCEFVENPKKDYTEYSSGTNKTFTINAQTGKMLDPYDKSMKGAGDAGYKGFIPWDDVR